MRKDFAWDKTTALPALLAGRFKGEKPLYEDLRWATKAVHLSRKHPQFASALAKLSAAIRLHGVVDNFAGDMSDDIQVDWRKEEPAPDASADLLNVITTSGEFPKQAERRAPGTPGLRRLVADSPSAGREFSDSIDRKIGQSREHSTEVVADRKSQAPTRFDNRDYRGYS